MKKGASSYYSEKIIRKLFGYAHHSGLLKEENQASLMVDLIEKKPLEVNLSFQKKFIGLGFLEEQYEDELSFEEGVAISKKGGSVNPLTPAVYALHNYNKYVASGLEKDYVVFHKQWEYLEAHRKSNETGSFWEYEHDFKRFELKGPWVSGLAQGMIAAVYLRKHLEEKNKEYLKLANDSISFCFHEANGLYTSLGSDDRYWIEEYPAVKGKGVLNGYLFFLIALGEMCSVNEGYKQKFLNGLNSVLSELPFYHKGQYLKYSKNIPDLSNRHYQEIHAYQLEHLYQLTNAKVFESLKNYWLLISGVENFY